MMKHKIVSLLCLGTLMLSGCAQTSSDQNAKQEYFELDLGGQSEQYEESTETDTASVFAVPAVVTDQMVCDIDGPVLDYADENTMIFHHYFGLFVYNINESHLDSSVNLEELGCLNEQGELDCEVFVSKDGNEVYLHPTDAEDMYVYDVLSKTIVLQHFEGESFTHSADLFVRLKFTGDCVDPDYTVWRSANCVTLMGGGYLYLECGSGMVEDLYYIVEQNGERTQNVRIFDDDKEGKRNAARF